MIEKKNIVTSIVCILFGILICATYLRVTDEKINFDIQKVAQTTNSPPSLQLYNIIEDASDSFRIPKYILYNIAFLETRYRGPFDWSYDPCLTSQAGAVGPMQIIPRYAHSYAGRKVTSEELRTNLKLNVEVSCKMLKKLYSLYHSWELVLGYYNTGNPIINEYAAFGSSNTDYKKNWITYE